MATHDYVIANASGAAVRADLNNALAAIVSNNSGSSEPGTTYAFQWWADTNASQLKLRNAANDDWVVIQELDGTMLMENGTVGSPGLAFASDLDTGFFRPAANQLAVATNGIERVEFGTTEVVFNDGGNDINLRVEGDTDANLFFVDAGNDRIGISTNAPAQVLHLNPAADCYVTLQPGSTDGNSGFLFPNSAGTQKGVILFDTDNDFMQFSTGDTERMRIDSSGRLLVGTSSGSSEPIAAFQGRSTDASDGAMIALTRTGATPSGTIGIIQFATGSDYAKHYASIIAGSDGTVSSSSTPGNLRFSTTASGATSATERMRIDSTGEVIIGATTYDQANTGIGLGSGGLFYATRAGLVAVFNRRTSDGEIISFKQDNSGEGSISVSGTTVSYNGAHLSRWSQLAGGAERTEILRGSVLSNLDEMCEWAYDAQDAVLYTENDELPEGVNVGDVKVPARDAGTEDNEQLNRMKVSDVEGDKNVSGVFQAWDDDDETYTNDFYCAMTGDFVIRIAKGTTVERGDLLMSAGDGTAKPQDDDIMRSKTIAKVTSNTVSTTYSDGSYCVPCVLMAC